MIRCRLQPGSAPLKTLWSKLQGRLLSTQCGSIFQIGYEKLTNLRDLEPKGGTGFTIDENGFTAKISFRVRSLKTVVRIVLNSQYSDGSDSALPCISGFPCDLGTLKERQ